jgi:MHS family shikimate/dehydroshikimate transporter-like MFS transporter
MAQQSFSQRGEVSAARVAVASAIGCSIEWYDFFLYGVVSAIVFNKLFFPTADPVVSTLLTWTTYAVGFVARPVGAIIFGHFGDRIGRRTILVLTLVIMGTATFLIGLLPTYDQIGIWSPLALLALRVLQGIGIGGEWGGAVLLSIEHARADKRGYYGAFPQIGVPAGLCLSAGVVAAISFFMSDTDFAAWGWRIAFLLSVVLVVLGIWIRVRLFETPAFLKVKESGREVRVPFMELWRTYPKNTLLGMGARYIEGVCFNTYGVYALSYLTAGQHLPKSDILSGITFASLIMIFLLPFWGWLSDKIGRRLQFGLAAIVTGVLVFPAFWVFSVPMSMPWIWLAIIVPFAIVYPAIYGPQAALFAELFDTRVRYSGVSFVYGFAGIFSSGLTPLIMSWLLLQGGGQPWLICIYVAVVSAISALSVYAMREGSAQDIATVPPAENQPESVRAGVPVVNSIGA